MNEQTSRASLYRTIWRWHFYAGLFVVPMVLILSLTGAAYLFKPQVERWEERAWREHLARLTPDLRDPVAEGEPEEQVLDATDL